MDMETRKRLHEQLRELGATTQRETAEVLDIVAAEFDIALAAERERCAKAAEEFLTRGRSPLGRAVADAIRKA